MFDVITIGTATRDIFMLSKEFKILHDVRFPSGKSMSFEAGEKIEIDDMIFETGGGATNSAVTFTRLGLKVATCCKIGTDVAAKNIKEVLKKERIKTSFIKEDHKNSTSVSVIFLSNSGERNVFVRRGTVVGEKDMFFDRLNTKWLYVSSLGGDIDLLEKIAKFTINKNIKLALNPGSKELKFGMKKLTKIFNATTVLILNRMEASDLMGVPYNFRKTIFRRSCDLTPGIEVITDGQDGAYASDEDQSYKVGIYHWPLVDRLGAGDAFGSGFVGGYIKYHDLTKALQYAAANASSVVTKIGAKAGIIKNFPPKPLDVKIESLS
jgi:sugar/nucleoside kinase (ribokinase family)